MIHKRIGTEVFFLGSSQKWHKKDKFLIGKGLKKEDFWCPKSDDFLNAYLNGALTKLRSGLRCYDEINIFLTRKITIDICVFGACEHFQIASWYRFFFVCGSARPHYYLRFRSSGQTQKTRFLHIIGMRTGIYNNLRSYVRYNIIQRCTLSR